MYNRYIPQPDGSFSRSRVEKKQETPPSRPQRPDPCPPPVACPEKEPEPPCKQQPECRPAKKDRIEQPLNGFLQNLLPRDLDTGDLIVILLLLLLAGDCEEDRSTAMLTLAIYLFM